MFNKFIDINNNETNLNLVASFICPSTSKSYVVINNNEKIFDATSKYENLDILEISTYKGNSIVLKSIDTDNWSNVKDYFFTNICGKILTDTIY